MSEVDGSNGGSSGSKDGSQGNGEWKPPSDGSWLPKVRVDEMVNDAKGQAARAADEAARLRAELDAERAKGQKKDEPKPVTRAELKSLVEDGRITQDAADTLWENQVIATAKREASKAAATEFAGQQRDLSVKQQFDEFRQLVPAAWETGAKERAKVEKEFNSLIALGFPNNKVTEVAALRAAFGDPEVIRAARSTGTNGPGEAHVEVGGGGKPADGAGDADGKPKGLTPRQEAHYQNLINRGVMKSWKDAAEELKSAKGKRG